jgi:predicted Zn-dependent peptidase
MALDSLYGMGPERYRRYAEEIEAITPDDVQAVARRILDFDRETVVQVGP